jgi:hypothetical protein
MAEYQAPESEEVMPQAREGQPGSAVADRVGRTAAPLQWINVSWDVVQSGDCFCRQASMNLYSDGLADFSAYTSTTDSGDVWLFKAFILFGPGPNASELYRIGQFDGPRMELENSDYFVIRTRQSNPLIYPQQLFPLIQSVSMEYHC